MYRLKTAGKETDLKHFTEAELKAMAQDRNIVTRITHFLQMNDADFFKEVRSRLSAEDLKGYLEENPDDRKYL